MRKAITQLESDTRKLLRSKLKNVGDYLQANEFLCSCSGIENFFETEAQFLLFKELVSQEKVIREQRSRREYGDYQTPIELTDKICAYLNNKDPQKHLIEPTFGKGAFIISALKHFPGLNSIYGIEIYEPYVWFSKFRILQFILKHPEVNKPKITLFNENIFDFDFRRVTKLIQDNVLLIGNPPWVTNAELSSLHSKNLPEKRNLKGLSGLDALTGNSNFDISEYIVLMLLKAFSDREGYFSMLVKNTVVKNLIHDLPKYPYKVSDISSFRIDAKRYFSASVEASLLTCTLNLSANTHQCRVGNFESPENVDYEFGWAKGKFVSNINLYNKSYRYDHKSPFVWRQGLKHDCSKVMELTRKNEFCLNGLDEKVTLEDELLYGLAKSSDLTQPILRQTEKVVIVTQTKIGEETVQRLKKFPHLYAYLQKHEALFKKRKSSIYKNKPPFSIFGIGDYSFKPYKVAISGLYKTPQFCLVLPQNDKPVMLDDTCYFLGFDDISHAIYVWTALNHPYTKELLQAIAFVDAKRPYTKKLLMRIDLTTLINDLDYDQVRDYVHSVDSCLSHLISVQSWLSFAASLRPDEPKEQQLTLF